MNSDSAALIFSALIIVIIILLLKLSSRNSKISMMSDEISSCNRRIDELSKNGEKLASQLAERTRELEKLKSEHTRELEKLKSERTRELEKLKKDVGEERQVFSERAKLFPWLARAFADLEELRGKEGEVWLTRKSHPAAKAAETVRAFSKRTQAAEEKSRHLTYRIDFYEKHFPWLTDFIGDSLESYLLELERREPTLALATENVDDPARDYLSDLEYTRLTTQERNQLALDRWKRKRKTSWEIGRDYERFIGYMFEKSGYSVEYFGAIEGFDDLGRDLIVRKQDQVRIVQCKYWSKTKQVHEKHVFQIFGSAVEYLVRQNTKGNTLPLFSKFEMLGKVIPEFVTSTTLSPRARDFATLLDVHVRENVPLGEYPIIKCNISRRLNERVYHLPFDQQYDNTVIEPERGEFYVSSVPEAEGKNFRRAYRWKPGKGD